MTQTMTGRLAGVTGDMFRVITGPRRAGYVSDECVYVERWALRTAKMGDTVTLQMRNGNWVVTQIH